MSFRYLFMILGLIIFAFVSLVKESFSQSTSFDKHIVTTSYAEGTEVSACDINQDGLADFISVGKGEGGNICWWKNNGYLEFEKNTVDLDLNSTRSARADDLDDDGDIDIVVAAWSGNSVTWHENDGNENWTRHYVDTNFIGAHTIDIKDVNDDGSLDVLCSSFDMSTAYSEIAWWENDGNQNWTKHVISTRFKQSPFIFGEDIDSDGDMDILACGELLGEVYWWENDGNQVWTEHEIDSQFPKAHTVFARDIDQDGDMDIIGAACMSSSIAWWENDGNQDWTKHPMGTLAGALWFDCADLDNDGDNDLYGGGQGASRLVWWENDGSSNFTRYDFDDPFSQTFAVVHADFDNDTDNDLVAIGYMNNQISWFSNNLIQPNLYTKPECVVYDDIFDRYIVANIGNGSLVETDTLNNSSYWVHGYEILYGMCIDNGILYTSDGDTLFGFHLATGNEVMAMKIINYNNLDGMTADGNGNLFVIDTWGRLLKVDLEAQTYEELVNQGLPDWPQDCVYDPINNRIVIAAYQSSAPIVAVDPETGEITTLSTNSVGRYDGITIDQNGNFYLASHVGGGRVYKYPNDFSSAPETIAYGLGEPTGLNYNQDDNILAVPSFNQDTVYFLRITTTTVAEPRDHGVLDVDIYPNPCSGKLHIIIHESDGLSLKTELFDQTGKHLGWFASEETGTSTIYTELDLSNYPNGTYFIRFTSGKKTAAKKLIVSK